jgi:hypothetical protein
VANKVDTRLTPYPDGTLEFRARNRFGTVHVIFDVYGYFEPIAQSPEPPSTSPQFSVQEGTVALPQGPGPALVVSATIPAGRVAFVATSEEKTNKLGYVTPCALSVGGDVIAEDSTGTEVFVDVSGIRAGLHESSELGSQQTVSKFGMVYSTTDQVVEVRCRVGGGLGAGGTATVSLAILLM